MKFLTPIILIVVSVGLFFFYIDPQWQEIKEIKTTKAEYDRVITESNHLLKIRDGLLGRYNNFKSDDLKRLEKMVPDNIDNVRLIIDINSITSKYGVTIHNVKLSTPGDAAPAVKGNSAPVTSVNGQNYNSMVLSFGVAAFKLSEYCNEGIV